MRLNETFRNEQITPECQTVYPELCAGWKFTDKRKFLILECMVYRYFFVIDNIIPEHAALFLLGRLPMESGGDQDDDVCIRISFADFL